MEKKKSFLIITVLVVACLFSITQAQGNAGRKVENGVRINTSAPTATKNMNVTTPNSLSKWTAGSTYNITWDGMPNAKVNVTIFLFNITSSFNSYTVIEKYATGTLLTPGIGLYKWTIPSNQPPSDSYEIIIMYFNLLSPNQGDVNYYYAVSNPFTISAPTSSTPTPPGFPVEIMLPILGISIIGIVVFMLRKHHVEA